MPGMSAAEKIIAMHTVEGRPEPGETVVARIDLVYAHDGTAPLALRALEEMGVDRVWDPSRVLFFIDHVAPSTNPRNSVLHAMMRRFAERNGIKLYEPGHGICHQVVFEEGYSAPGMLILGADSHTVMQGAVGAVAMGVGSTDAAVAMATGTLWLRVPEPVSVTLEGGFRPGVAAKDAALTLVSEIGPHGANYRSIEFRGGGGLTLSDRLCLANMTVEAGAQTAYFPPDGLVERHMELTGAAGRPIYPDEDAEYVDEYTLNLSELEPMVAEPYSPANARPVSELEGLEVDQVFIGSCTNGRLEDMEAAARILKGRRVKTRCIVIPASRRVLLAMAKRGLLEVFLEAGCTVTHGTCGPCVGAHFGILGPGEVMVSTANRNFRGRCGDPTAKVYLASPLTAAATAVEGRLTDPRALLR